MVSPIYFVVLPLAAAFLALLVNHDLAARIIGLVTGALLVALAWSWFRADLSSPVPVIVAGIPAPVTTTSLRVSSAWLRARCSWLLPGVGFGPISPLRYR